VRRAWIAVPALLFALSVPALAASFGLAPGERVIAVWKAAATRLSML